METSFFSGARFFIEHAIRNAQRGPASGMVPELGPEPGHDKSCREMISKGVIEEQATQIESLKQRLQGLTASACGPV